MDFLKTTYGYLVIGLLACFGGRHGVWAQSYSAKIRKVSIEDGLSNRFIRAVYQDSRGFVWLGTNYGLHSYKRNFNKLFPKETQAQTNYKIKKIYEEAEKCN